MISALDAGTGSLETAAISVAILGVLEWVFVLRGVFRIGANEQGVLTKMMFGKPMPRGQIIARSGEVGIQAQTLQPGLYYRFPFIWKIKRVPITDIAPDEVGLVESIDGQPLSPGRLLGNEVVCNNFQDAESFYENGGQKGPQVATLKPGRYRINTLAFIVTKVKAITIPEGMIGEITAQDGVSLPAGLVIAPEPSSTPSPTFPNARPNNSFQNGQAFIDSGGHRGNQLATLQPGQYYINTDLFTVKQETIYEIAPGFVGVVRSNVGVVPERVGAAKQNEIKTPTDTVTDLTADSVTKDEGIKEAEDLLVDDMNVRGIVRDPINPGKYQINLIAYTIYPVPTSAIMIDWASSNRPGAPSMSRPAASADEDRSDYPYLTDPTLKGQAYFNFSQLRVTSSDGFPIEVDVRMILRINPEDASFVIARFGSVFNLIQQIVHPLIDASFRNNAGNKGALEFLQKRTELQKDALDRAKEEFKPFHVEAQNLLVSYIDIPQPLLDTQTNKQIAAQQQAQYQQQALAEEQRIAVQEKTARANLQPQVVQAALQVEINANNAKAAVKQAEGQRDSAMVVADGTAYQTRKTGQAQAYAYQQQADVVGPEGVVFINAMDRIKDGHIKVTPDTLVTGSGTDGAQNGGLMLNAFLATMIQKNTEEHKQEHRITDDDTKNYESTLSGNTPNSGTVTIPTAPIPSTLTSATTARAAAGSGSSDLQKNPKYSFGNEYDNPDDEGKR